jgi:hypothetical protein
MTAIKRQKSIDKFRHSCSAELQLRSDNLAGGMCGTDLRIRIHGFLTPFSVYFLCHDVVVIKDFMTHCIGCLIFKSRYASTDKKVVDIKSVHDKMLPVPGVSIWQTQLYICTLNRR